MATALRRILREMAEMRREEDSEEGWFALPLADDPEVNLMSFDVDICGPDTYTTNPTGSAETRPSPYKDGLFKIHVDLESNYPQSAPKIRFVTKCWHPNIDFADGKVCNDWLRDEWSATKGLRDALVAVRNLLAAPNADDSVNADAAREMHENVDVFDRHAAAETAKYATA